VLLQALPYKADMSAFENYLKELRDIRATGAAVAETSFYPALSNLFNEIGKGLRPKVRCIMPIADRGAGLPDGGFFAANQFRPPDSLPLRRRAVRILPGEAKVAPITEASG
jgi:hypothetical protein